MKLTKNKEVELPTTIFGLGSATSGEERSIWRVTYPGAPRRCFRCGNSNHIARDCRRQPITMEQVEKMPGVGEVRIEGVDAQEQQKNFALSFAAVVKSDKFLQAAAQQEREDARQREERERKKETEEKKREDDRKAKEENRKEKAQQQEQEVEAKRVAHLAGLAKTVEKAVLHKNYVKNLHSKAKAEQKETAHYEQEMENMVLPGGESSKRQASSPLLAPPQGKKVLSESNL